MSERSKDRDRVHPNHASPDTLTPNDVNAYRDGRWAARVTSEELQTAHGERIDPDGIAELAARCEVMGE
jgi:hypothetical protein